LKKLGDRRNQSEFQERHMHGGMAISKTDIVKIIHKTMGEGHE
jgi:hypothetical protein